MQSLARRQSSVRHCYRFFLNRRTRSFNNSSKSALSDHLLINDHESCVLVEGNASSRTAVLNRPSVLNALNVPLFSGWRSIGKQSLYFRGNGSAFCAGAYIVSVRDMIRKGDIEGSKEIFWRVYSFAYLLHTYLKPNVAILDGVTMGGGAAISIPGTFRIATDKTIYATPETFIGLHPDAGASFHLSHLPGYLGEYLGLTGDRLNGVEMIACGLATHYSHSRKVPAVAAQLVARLPSTSIDLDFPHNNSVLKRMETIDKCFSHKTVEEIIDALESEASKTHDEWCNSTLKKLKYASPLSLKISLRSIREGRFQTLDQCLIREYRLTSRAMSCKISSDFCEGVRPEWWIKILHQSGTHQA